MSPLAKASGLRGGLELTLRYSAANKFLYQKLRWGRSYSTKIHYKSLKGNKRSILLVSSHNPTSNTMEKLATLSALLLLFSSCKPTVDNKEASTLDKNVNLDTTSKFYSTTVKDTFVISVCYLTTTLQTKTRPFRWFTSWTLICILISLRRRLKM